MEQRICKIGDKVKWSKSAIQLARENKWVVKRSYKWWEQIHTITRIGYETFGDKDEYVILNNDESTYSNVDELILIKMDEFRDKQINKILDVPIPQ